MTGNRGLLNSLMKSRPMMLDPERDLKLLIQEYASLLAHQNKISLEHIKEHIPALLESVVVRHPLYKEASRQYYATNPELVADGHLASSVKDVQTQHLIMALGQILVDAEMEYLASVNTVQQVASEVLSANIRAVRRAGRVIKDHGPSESIQLALKKHDKYLELLSRTEKLIQSGIDALTKEKNGDESYVESCNILVNVLKKSMKQKRGARGQSREEKPNDLQESFLDKVRSRLNKPKLMNAVIISFLPDIYEAINPGITDAQMEVLVSLAQHYVSLGATYRATEQAFKALSPLERQSLAQGGVKLLSPYDYVMAVVYDPMQMAVKYFSDQFDAYLQPVYMAKNAANAVADVAYSATSLIATPFTYARDFFFSPDRTYTEKLMGPIFSKTHPLNEMTYLKGMAFYGFLRGLNRSNQLSEENKAALFGHYFHHNAANGEQELSLDQYRANEEHFARVFLFFNESGALDMRKREDFENEEDASLYLLAVISRVNHLQAALGQTKSVEEVEAIIGDLQGFYSHFKGKPFAQEYLATKLHLILPLINDRLLVPVIYRLVDEGIVTKEHDAYIHLGEILKVLRKKQLVSAEDILFVVRLLPDETEAKKLKDLVFKLLPWMLGGKIVTISAPEIKANQPCELLASIRTDMRDTQATVQSTLALMQPRLILDSIIAHLDNHIKKTEKLQDFSSELNEVYAAKLVYCNTVKQLLLRILDRGLLDDHKRLAKTLTRMDVGLPTMPSYDGTGDMVKLFFRVADEFGPVSGGDDGVPLVEKILSFILSEMNSEVLAEAYDALKRVYANRNKVIEGNDHDDLSLVWFEEESADPFDMSVQGGHIARVVISHYMDALIGTIYDKSGLNGVLEFFNKIPGYTFISGQLSHYAGKVLTREMVVNLICRILGMQVHTNLHEQDYLTRLSHAFFKVKAMQGVSVELRAKVELAGLVSQPEELGKMSVELATLIQLTSDFSFEPLAHPQALAEMAFQHEGELREQHVQLLLVHCDYLVKYAKRLSDEAKRSTILFNVLETMAFCSRQDETNDLLTTKQATMVLRLLEEGKTGSRAAAEQAKENVTKTIDTVKAQVKEESDGVIRRATRKRTTLNIVGTFGYYLGDLGLLAWTIASLFTPVLSFIAQVKALSSITFLAVSLAAGTALVASHIGLALLVLRFVGGLAWHAYQCRRDFRKDWKASQSVLGKVGVIAKYSLIVLGRALLSTFLSAALVDTAVGLVRKVRGLDIPLVNFIKDKLNVRAKLRELEKVKAVIQVLKGCVMDGQAFDALVVKARESIAALKYHKDKAAGWTKQVDQAVEHRDAFKRLSVESSTDQLVAKTLKANPAPKASVPAPAWDDFVKARAAGQVVRFGFDVTLPDWHKIERSRVSVLGSSLFDSMNSANGSIIEAMDAEAAPDVSSGVDASLVVAPSSPPLRQ
jgi:hypothetical protein